MCSSYLAAKSDNKSLLMNNNYGASSGVYINSNNEGFYLDGHLELQSRLGFFGEISINDYYIKENPNQYYCFSAGFLKKMTSDNIFGWGYSNYFDNANEINHEIFTGSTYKNLSALVYLNLETSSINYEVLVNLNSYLIKTPFDINISLLNDSFSTDVFFRISKYFESGFSIGYVLSRESYEDTQILSYNKNGIKGEYKVDIIESGFFNEVYLGISF
mgnify:CR=1 FL=1|tara:strand:- start:501 stop:1151 length:651 start_codon:yes stop_codon:yes gene_type:complete